MITAVDTNVLLDVLIPGAPHGDESERALTEALRAGAIIVSEPVYAELAAHFSSSRDLNDFLEATGLRLKASERGALYGAGKAWGEYVRRRPATLECSRCGASQDPRCERCGSSLRPRRHVVADFIIGAHALVHADRLLTRDRGYYATYFPGLSLA